MDMACPLTIRYKCFCRQQSDISPVRRMRFISAYFPACKATRHGAVESRVSLDCVIPLTALGFWLACGKSRHPLTIHRATHFGGMNLPFLSHSSQAPLWAIPAPWRRGAALLRLHRPTAQRARAGNPKLRRPAGLGSSLKGALQESASWPWEPGPARGFARCALSRSGD